MNFNALSPEALGLLFFFSSLIFLLLGILLGMSIKKRIVITRQEEELKKIIRQEKAAKAEAMEAIKARDEFLSIATHELKTPLTTIILRIQSTLDSILNDSLANFSGEKLVSSLNIAYEQTNRLQKLIKDLLNFSLITRGKLELEPKPGDLNEIVKSTLSRFEDHLILAGCQLKFTTTGTIPGLWDQIRIEQVISNLLTNSIKYGQGKPIEVEVKKEKNIAKISVSDNGIGIDPKLQKSVFERFKRATTDNHYQGLGVGLFIVKQIVDAHQGKISLKSRLGQGSNFTIEIPIKEISLNEIGIEQKPTLLVN